MTDRSGPARDRAQPGSRAATVSWLAALCAFAILLALLGWRMSSGRDPSLGAAKPATAVATAPRPRRVVIRRIERKVIVTRVLPARRVAAPVAPAYVAPSASAPSTAYVAPQRVAVRAPAPAPPPAPAAVTRAS